MPKYHVDVEITDTFQVTVEAENEEEATAAAVETMVDLENPNNSKHYSYSSGFEATSCQLADEGEEDA